MKKKWGENEKVDQRQKDKRESQKKRRTIAVKHADQKGARSEGQGLAING